MRHDLKFRQWTLDLRLKAFLYRSAWRVLGRMFQIYWFVIPEHFLGFSLMCEVYVLSESQRSDILLEFYLFLPYTLGIQRGFLDPERV